VLTALLEGLAWRATFCHRIGPYGVKLSIVEGQTPWGAFHNLGPQWRADREALNGWYLYLHLGPVRLGFWGPEI
jgi:hypothetical protein